MLNTDVKIVVEILKDNKDIQTVKFDDGSKGYNYPAFCGNVNVGEEVYVNTTAVDLSLGTGGYHFIISKLNPTPSKDLGPGHIMKLRYTPLQVKTHTLEEQIGEELDRVELKNHIVITIELHSMLAPIVLALNKINPEIRISYVMTDGGALPAYHSETVKTLKQHQLIEGVITTGHAFGGDLESVNFITAIQGSVKVYNSHVTIIGMGPGIVGTGTQFGFTGVEQGMISDVAQNLGCDVYPAIRLGFADQRDRHKGISHHFLTNFGKIAKGDYPFVLPVMDKQKISYCIGQMRNNGLNKKHQVYIAPSVDITDEANKYKIKLSSMGKGYSENPEYFDALTALSGFVNKRPTI